MIGLKAEIIAVGTELLMGETQDTNSSWMGSRLPELGLELQFAVAVAADQIKIGSIVRSERLAKYNRLLRISEQVPGWSPGLTQGQESPDQEGGSSE